MVMARGKAIATQAVTDSAFYDIHGVGVTVSCAHAEVMERIHGHQSYYGRPSGAPAVRVEIAKGPVSYPVPLHARRVLRYGSLRAYHLDGVTWFTDYFSTLEVSADGGAVVGNVCEDSFKDWGVDFFVNVMFPVALFEALRFHGLFYTHAAGLVSPSGRGYLISGNAGSGKTTLTLSLVHGGYRFLSDDTVFLRLKDGDDVEVLGFAREFHVPLDLVTDNEAFHEYQALPDYRSYKKKKTLRPEDWFPELILDSVVNPSVILFPKMREGEPGLEPMSKARALTELLPQSLSVMFQPGPAKNHLEAMKRVLGHATPYRMWSGPDLRLDPRKVVELLERAGPEGEGGE